MKVGSLFTGYGGLDIAVGGDLAWYAEIEPAACKVLAAHFPGIPNLGDIKCIDWSQVEPVDIITGGYPCQPFSHAGLRKGTHDDRHLWPYIRDAISALRPRLVVLENVRGHLTLGVDTVLGEMAGVGYDARWGVVRACDAGAPHQRARVFIVSTPAADADGRGHGIEQDAGRVGSVEGGAEGEASQRQRTRPEPGAGGFVAWGKYAAAIDRWERLTRPAPQPTITDPKTGKQRLNPVFVEWMMGLPEGHVTGHGLTNAQALKMLGNGVVPQQAALALRLLGAAA